MEQEISPARHTRQRKTLIIIALIAAALLLVCCCCTLIGSVAAGWWGYDFFQKQLSFMLPEDVPPAPPELAGPTIPADRETLDALVAAEIPIRDARDLALRLKGIITAPVVVHETPIPLQVGDRATFWVADNSDPEHVKYAQVEAQLIHISEHAYFWVEDGFEVEMDALERSAADFDQIYQLNRRVFGEEWSPGIDGDPRIHVFNGNVRGVGGYFSSSDEVSQLVNPRSNEREMFYINLQQLKPGSPAYGSVLAHEFQHMIHANVDRNEPSWTDEGFAELATYLNGYSTSGGEMVFPMFGADTQLTTWTNEPGRAFLHYGASYVFMRYFYTRFGEDAVRAVVADPREGAAGLAGELGKRGYTFDEFFKEWTLANYLNDPTLADGRYESPGLIQPMKLDRTHTAFPVERTSAVRQYGVDYILFASDTAGGAAGGQPSQGRTLHVTFDGADRARVLPTAPHSGDYFWYSHRGDDSNMTLTRRFDLRGLTAATLAFWTWYDIEHGWDYGYVEVSADGGRSWTVLRGRGATDYNPAGNSFGPGYTGESKKWVRQELNLNAYAGQEVLVRFEYVTDDAYNRPGWALDDIAVPELVFVDDVEDGDAGWEAHGFVRITNYLPQTFAVQFIVYEKDGDVTLHDLALDAAQQGEWEIADFGGQVEKAVMVVSGLTPVTTEWAYYTYHATLESQP